jgi:hypothetical protein
MPNRSLTAFCSSACSRGVVLWFGSRRARARTGSDPVGCQQDGHRCGVEIMRSEFPMPAMWPASRASSHNTFAVIPLSQTRPVLLIDRKIAPSVVDGHIRQQVSVLKSGQMGYPFHAGNHYLRHRIAAYPRSGGHLSQVDPPIRSF